ncbi:AI-2E family transporter [Actinomyces vulturis]|uniref:AI-2E family transporter n=1 Tax=Actinomyces vulturis TaxID=1857645 RepID=UPI0009F18714|nr:AI-2E family transporter [Actinomyces vulturis]
MNTLTPTTARDKTRNRWSSLKAAWTERTERRYSPDDDDQVVFTPVPHNEPERESVASLLPAWLIRAGLGAWLLLGILIIIACVVFATSKVIPVFIGVFLAFVFTAILLPVVNFYAKIMPRYPATFLALLTAVAVVGALIYYVVDSVRTQWNDLAEQFSTGVNTIVDFVENGPLPIHLTQAQLSQQIDELTIKGQQYLRTNAPTLAGEVLNNAGTVVVIFTVLALALFTTIFFLASGSDMWRWFLNELPAHLRQSVHRAAGAGWYTFSAYARGTVIVALTDGMLAGIFLQIIHVPLAAPLGVLVFIGAFIPMVGAPLAMLVAMMVGLATGGVVTMIVVCLGVAGIGQIEGHILQPLIMGRQVSLHPAVVGIAVAIGTFAAGLLGAVIAVPIVGVTWSVYSELHEKDAPLQGELPSYERSDENENDEEDLSATQPPLSEDEEVVALDN